MKFMMEKILQAYIDQIETLQMEGWLNNMYNIMFLFSLI